VLVLSQDHNKGPSGVAMALRRLKDTIYNQRQYNLGGYLVSSAK
jgi:hypothetical protein